MLLLKILILFLAMFFLLGIIGAVWGGFWAFVAIGAFVVGAYDEWSKNK